MRGVTISTVAESVSPLTEREMSESESTESGADVAVSASESGETGDLVADENSGAEHGGAEQSLIDAALAVEGEPGAGDVAGLALPVGAGAGGDVTGEYLDGDKVPVIEPVASGGVVADSVESVETIVRNVLLQTYGRYWLSDDVETLNRVVELLTVDPPSHDPLAETAGRVRAVLWKRSASGGPSAAVTCNIFSALGRTDELGWIAREAVLYTEGL